MDAHFYFTAIDAARLADITRRQLDYWVKTELIEPAVTAPKGKAGNVTLFNFENLFQLRILKALIEAGFSIQALRRITEDDYDEREQARPEERPIISSSRSEPAKLDMAGILEAFKRGEFDVLPVLTNDGLIKLDLATIHEELEYDVEEHEAALLMAIQDAFIDGHTLSIKRGGNGSEKE